MKTNRLSVLIISGLLVISISQIMTHYIQLPDLLSGAITGVGIGLMIIALFKSKKNITG